MLISKAYIVVKHISYCGEMTLNSLIQELYLPVATIILQRIGEMSAL